MNPWKITLNLHKFSMIRISNKQNNSNTKYSVNGFPFNCVSGVGYLGVSISSNMSWSNYIYLVSAVENISLSFFHRNL